MENALTIYQNQIILGSSIIMLISLILVVSYFTAKIKDKTMIGLSIKEIESNLELSDDDKFNLIIINHATILAFIVLFCLIYIVGHM